MAITKFHGPVVKNGKTSRHMHMLVYPSGFTTGEIKGSISSEGTSCIVTVDGRDGHWHIDFEKDLQRILDKLPANPSATADREEGNGAP